MLNDRISRHILLIRDELEDLTPEELAELERELFHTMGLVVGFRWSRRTPPATIYRKPRRAAG